MTRPDPYADEAVVAQMTRLLVDAGHPILQSHRLGPTDRDHAAALLALFYPPVGSHVLDIGCGVGAVAAHMATLRPGLQFTLLNLSPAQIAMASPDSARVAADMHDLPFPDRSFDAAMFNFSLGHGRLDTALGEAARVVRAGGVVFLYELTSEAPDAIMAILGYRPHRIDEILHAAYRAGLKAGSVICPPTSTAAAEALFGKAWTDRGFDRCWPVAVRFVVQGQLPAK